MTRRQGRRTLAAATGIVLAAGLGLPMASATGGDPVEADPPADPVAIALDHLRRDPAEVGVTRSDVAELAVASSHRSTHSGITHVNVSQRHHGLEVFGSVATVNVAPDGRVVFIGGELVPGLADRAAGTARIGPAAAVREAADALDLGRPKQLRVLSQRSGSARSTTMSKAGISEEPIPARLGWQPTDGGLRRAWQLVIDDRSDAHLWNATVDAQSGELLEVDDWTSQDSPQDLARIRSHGAARQPAITAASGPASPDPVDDGSSYRVFASPKEGPNDGPRTLVANPADAAGSPYGWHDTDGAPGPEFTITRGNNAHAYLDQDDNGAPDLGGAPFEPYSGEVYAWSQAADISYKRLTRQIAVPADGGSLSFWTDYDIEAAWDHLFVEARTAGGGDWTTLPDANGHTSQATGESCPAGWRQLHPHLNRYQSLQAGTCTPTGTTGEWHAASGDAGGWQEWSVDVSQWAGETVEVSIAYASDWGGQGDGVAIDDVTAPDGTTTSFESGLGGWEVTGSPERSAANSNDWTRTDPTSLAVGDTDGGEGLDFDFPADLREHPQNYRDAAVTNLFYWNNIVHDVTARYGFDEAAGNFQVDNYGRGGTGGDYVRAEAADGGGVENANFATPVETSTSGGTPRMQMYLWPGDEFGPQNQVVVDGVGTFDASWSRFGAAPSVAGTTGRLYDAGDGCTAADYAGNPGGDWIALTTGGNAGCQNVDKARRAAVAGAGAIVVAAETIPTPLTGPQAAEVSDIAVASITASDGDTVRAAIATGSATGSVRKHPEHPGIRDGDLDAGIVIHEYGHGVSLRLTGGPTTNCLNGDEQAGEGWSDYLALALLLDPEVDDPDGPRGMGTYAMFQADRQKGGIRPAPYSRNMAIQPATYDSIKSSGWLDAQTLSLAHGIGHVWAATLWDMTWDLIDKHGFNPNVYGDWDSGGNNRAIQYVIDGLKFQGCNPGMVDARDAIIAAADELSDGDDTCTLWASFARRGLGFSATQGSFFNRNDNDEAFDTHPDCQDGFSGRVADPPKLNDVRAGANVPLIFGLGGDEGLDILASGSPYSRRVDCETLKTVDPQSRTITPRPLPVETRTPGRAELSYDPVKDRYTYPWKTLSQWANTCREVVVARTDGVQHRAYFRFGPEQEPPPSPVLQQWEARYNGPANSDDFAEAGVLSPDGSRVFVTGRSIGDGTGLDYSTVAYDAVTGDELWSARYNGPPGSSPDIAWDVAVSPDGSSVFVTGQSAGGSPITDYATVAYDAATGEELWVARSSGPGGGLDVARAVTVSPDGAHVFVTGQQLGAGTSLDFATVAYDAATGEELWLRSYNGTFARGNGTDVAEAVTVTPDGAKVLITGRSSGDRSGDDYATVAYDAADGTELWVARYNGPGNRTDEPHAMSVSPDGRRVFVTGRSLGVGTNLPDYATVAYDATDGAELWAARYDGTGSGSDVARAIAVAPDGQHVFVTGSSFTSDTEGLDYATVAYDAVDGAQAWVAHYNGPARNTDAAWAMAVSEDGSRLVVTGQSLDVGNLSADYATVSYDAKDGTEHWEARYDGPGIRTDIPRWVGLSPDGQRVVVTGQSEGQGTDDDYATVGYEIVPLEDGRAR